MTLKYAIALLVLTSAPFAAAQTEPQTEPLSESLAPDTLLTAARAESLEISSTRKATNITLEGLDNTSKNFYYQCQSARGHVSFNITHIICDDVSDICVVNYEDRVTVDFKGANGAPQSYTLYFENPENRQYKSYIGHGGGDFGFSFARRGNVQWDVVSNGLSFGWVAAVNDKPDMDVSMWKSNELSWDNILAVQMRSGRHAVSLGVGLLWQNFVTKGNRYFNLDMENGVVGFTPYPEGASHLRSRIMIFSWQMPLLYRLKFGHENYCRFFAGPVVCFNAHSSIKTEYKLGGREYSVVTKNIGHRPVTVDLLAGFSYRGIGFFVRYSPMKKLRDRTMLPFNSISTGLTLGF